jgi:hypothetical protein
MLTQCCLLICADAMCCINALLLQIYRAKLDDPQQLFEMFRSNQYFGAIVMASIVSGIYYSAPPDKLMDMFAAIAQQ